MDAPAASFAVHDFQGASMRSLVPGEDAESRSLSCQVHRVTSRRHTARQPPGQLADFQGCATAGRLHRRQVGEASSLCALLEVQTETVRLHRSAPRNCGFGISNCGFVLSSHVANPLSSNSIRNSQFAIRYCCSLVNLSPTHPVSAARLTTRARAQEHASPQQVVPAQGVPPGWREFR